MSQDNTHMNYQACVQAMLLDLVDAHSVDRARMEALLNALVEGLARTCALVTDHKHMHEVAAACGQDMVAKACRMHIQLANLSDAETSVLHTYNPEKFDD